MVEEDKRRGGGPKTARTETLTVRFEPRLRYLTEIAARAQRRTMSSYIEGVVADSLRQVEVRDPQGQTLSIAAAADILWSENEFVRLKTLSVEYPFLLTVDEKRLLDMTTQACEYVGIPKSDAKWRLSFIENQWDRLKRAVENNLSFEDIASQFVVSEEKESARRHLDVLTSQIAALTLMSDKLKAQLGLSRVPNDLASVKTELLLLNSRMAMLAHKQMELEAKARESRDE